MNFVKKLREKQKETKRNIHSSKNYINDVLKANNINVDFISYSDSLNDYMRDLAYHGKILLSGNVLKIVY